jgi:hypothetical protein
MQQQFTFLTTGSYYKMRTLQWWIHSRLFITDEAWFYLSGHVSTHNTWIWSDENYDNIQQVPLH